MDDLTEVEIAEAAGPVVGDVPVTAAVVADAVVAAVVVVVDVADRDAKN